MSKTVANPVSCRGLPSSPASGRSLNLLPPPSTLRPVYSASWSHWLRLACFIFVLCAWGNPAIGQVKSFKLNMAELPALAQTWDRDRRSNGPSPKNKQKKSEQAQILSETMRLIKEYYVEDVSAGRILENTLQLLTMTLPPQCSEDVMALSNCAGPPEQCFLQAVNDITERCGVDKETILTKALNIVLRELDPNSSFLDSAMLKELEISMSGKFGGVGMVVSAKDGEYVVVSSFDSSPAEKAGIEAGDIIEEIDGRPVHGLSLVEVLGMVRGPAGSRMSVTMRPRGAGQKQKIVLRRQTISIPPVRFVTLDDGIGYLRIVNFQEQTAREVTKALTPLASRQPGKLKGLILDLRDNPGGLFTEAIRVADLFLSGTVITSVRGRNPRLNREFTAMAKENPLELPIVILINKGTASAAEILAGALQGRHNVLVAGERSFGKASVQAVFPVQKGAAIRLTTAHYFTADGRDIDGKGLDPDFELEPTHELNAESLGISGPTAVQVDREVKDALQYLVSGRLPGRSPFSSLY